MPKAHHYGLPTAALAIAAAGLLTAAPAAASERAPAMTLGAIEAPPAGFLELCSRAPEHCTAAAAPSAADLEVLRQQASRTYFSLAFGRPLPDAAPAREAPAAGPAPAPVKSFAALVRPGAGFGRALPAPAVEPDADAEAPVEALAAADLARPAVARVRAPEAAPLTLERADWRRVQRINREINRAIRHREDRDVYGRADLWAAGDSGVGDCEDYALAKRAALIQAGVPARALSIALVETRRGESHAVLLIDTDKGAMVLDNLSPWIRRWDQTPYTWIARQTPGDPLTWRAVSA
jgi:predicted transglutaminase-like cysteine proteinase